MRPLVRVIMQIFCNPYAVTCHIWTLRENCVKVKGSRRVKAGEGHIKHSPQTEVTCHMYRIIETCADIRSYRPMIG